MARLVRPELSEWGKRENTVVLAFAFTQKPTIVFVRYRPEGVIKPDVLVSAPKRFAAGVSLNYSRQLMMNMYRKLLIK